MLSKLATDTAGNKRGRTQKLTKIQSQVFWDHRMDSQRLQSYALLCRRSCTMKPEVVVSTLILTRKRLFQSSLLAAARYTVGGSGLHDVLQKCFQQKVKSVLVSEEASVRWKNPHWQQVTEALLVFHSLVLSCLVQITHILRLNDKTLKQLVPGVQNEISGIL